MEVHFRCSTADTWIPITGHRHHRLHMRRYSSCGLARYRIDVRCGFVQACCWSSLCFYHNQQEPLGIWIQQIHYALDHQVGLHCSDYDQHGVDDGLVPVRYFVLVQRQDVPTMVKEQQGSPNVIRACMLMAK
jgi:hypothetical protein